MLNAYNFIVLYVLIFWAEFWLLARIFGNKLEGSPFYFRVAFLIVAIILPAIGALAVINSPVQLPDY